MLSDPPTPASKVWLRTTWLSEPIMLLARLYAGLTIASAGFDKLPTPDWMVDQVVQLELFPQPELFALIACFTEFVCGLLLALGLFTRSSGLLLAFTMGVAAFRFHRVAPLVGMHIAQGFFWLFLMFVALGPGRFSLDFLLRRPRDTEDQPWPIRRRLGLVLAAVALLGAVCCGLYREFVYQPPPPPETQSAAEQIASLALAGSFNEWSLTQHPLQAGGVESEWTIDVTLTSPGLLEFKFAANESWSINLGAAEDCAATLPVQAVGQLNGENIQVEIPVPGRYRFTVNTTTLEYAVAAVDERT